MQLFIEILVEELPATFVRPALESLKTGVVGLLDGIEHGAVRTYATPRRLAVAIDGVAASRPVVELTVTGPPVSSAFKDGEPTKVGLGFARGKGVDPSALKIVEGPKGPVVAVDVREGGQTTVDLLAAGLDAVVLGIPFKKSMEWGEGGVRFARPLHRLNVVFDGKAVVGSGAGMAFGAETLGHRLTPGPIAFTDEASWLEGLRAHHVEPDLDVREQQIQGLLVEAQERLGCDPIVDADLLEEVLHLVEAPVLVLGAFDAELLSLPARLLIKSMKSHQRYFPVFRQGALTEHFVVISNNPFGDHDRIAEGNANVLRARFHDAKFFFAEDRKKPLLEHGRQLDKMRWIKGLGSVADKGERLAALGAALAHRFGADPEQVALAARLCKCDLATLMVGEFADLQGHMGRLYAQAEGMPAAVSDAIEEHYRPASATDDAPTGPVAATLALADRLDSLVGCFAIGLVPKGSGDPQGLRRAVLGVLKILQAHNVPAELPVLFEQALDVFGAHAATNPEGYDAWKQIDKAAVIDALVEFTSTRFRANAVKQGVSGDVVDAVLAVGSTDTLDRQARLDALADLARSEDFLPVMRTFKRVLNITKDLDFPLPTTFGHDAERTLANAAVLASTQLDAAVGALDYPAAFRAALSLNEPVSRFFEDVLVEDPDPEARARRMGILLAISRSFLRLADFSRISTR